MKAILIAGMPFELTTDEEAEKADFVVCATAGTPTPFTDNIDATCAGCGCAIFHRPHAPKAPPKMCISCAMDVVSNKGKATN